MSSLNTLSELLYWLDLQPTTHKLPAIFTSHGNPMDIIKSRTERPFWNTLYELGKKLKLKYDIRAALVISAHWCTRGSFVNICEEQKQIYDYYGFPDEYYQVKYKAIGKPDLATEIAALSDHIQPTTEWGLDHGAWPMLMHLFPDVEIPVFQLSIDYYAKPMYHFELGKVLAGLRNKGILIIGSGAIVHNLPLAIKKMQENDTVPYGWEAEYDDWVKKQLMNKNFSALIEYLKSHPLGKMAAPTPDHYVPMLYVLGTMDQNDEIKFFYEAPTSLPAFSETSFLIS
ncbi:MAG: dioxygenase [Bacteroidia bacterium]|nr:dioxygenase [Bacteroidia bacterium]